jgi:hypothetical protein
VGRGRITGGEGGKGKVRRGSDGKVRRRVYLCETVSFLVGVFSHLCMTVNGTVAREEDRQEERYRVCDRGGEFRWVGVRVEDRKAKKCKRVCG